MLRRAARLIAQPGSGQLLRLCSSAASAGGPFELSVGTYCISKDQSNEQKPDPNKSKFPCNCGEDAFFVLQQPQQSFLGVLDGVGGWRDQGVDPAEFTWKLADAAKASCEASPETDMETLFKNTLENRPRIMGSSTLCFARIDHATGLLDTCNFGDSGLRVFRNAEVVFRTTDLTFDFNFPYQISADARRTEKPGLESFQLQKGDIVVLGTDGLFDNVFDDDLGSTVDYCQLLERMKGSELAAAVAKVMASLADRLAHIDDYESPFAKEAATYGYKFDGGKVDDITVVVGCIE
eukprot:m.132251 g.132251  ORF g.132251 m.132251 type:complete len:293 (-) comp9830_c0_seq2:190-1068(-)